MSNIHELPVPQDAGAAFEAVEVLRAWVVDKGLHCSLFPTAFDDSSSWGILLADVVRHIGNAIEQTSGTPQSEVTEAIRSMFNAELDHPTDDPQGEFVETPH